ncbi:MAG: hypothetical protein IRZ21_03895 [Thermoleophilaceae bacterium]|nr:hypothetical protein [Thermoleophilaceae bacterium]
MSGRARVELERPRDLGELLGESLSAYFRNFRTLFTVGLAVVAPVELIVAGFGLGRLTAGWDADLSTGAQLVELAVSYVVIAPLVTAMTVEILKQDAGGRRPRAWPAIVVGLEQFRPLFFTLVLAALGITLGFVAFLVPGVYLAVRWTFATQAVLFEDLRNVAALQRSGKLVTGSWWRVLGIGVVAFLVAGIATAVIGVPFGVAASATDSAAITLAGTILAESLTGPFLAAMLTLLYFDLRARSRLSARA